MAALSTVWVLLIVCCFGLTSGAPAPRSAETLDYPCEDGQPCSLEEQPEINLDELHIWDDNKPINSTAEIPSFKPAETDTSDHCPSCLPDALLGGRPRW